MTSSPDYPDYLDAHAATQLYLTLPREYADALGSVRWSDQVDGLVLAGRMMASYEDLAAFLEGFASQRPLLAFGLMIHWATLLGAESADRQFVRLRNAFQTHHQNWRNAGALAAMISDTLLPAANPPPLLRLGARLRNRAFPIRWFTGLLNGMSGAGEDPPHTLIEFEQHARAGIAALSDDDLASWLKFGRGPVRRAGETLAGERPPPRVFGSILDELLERPRLAGAAVYL